MISSEELLLGLKVLSPKQKKREKELKNKKKNYIVKPDSPWRPGEACRPLPPRLTIIASQILSKQTQRWRCNG